MTMLNIEKRKNFLEDNTMKTWKNAEVVEVRIEETAGGFIKTFFEGPLDIIFGKSNPTTPETPSEPAQPVQPEIEPATPSDNDDPTSLRS